MATIFFPNFKERDFRIVFLCLAAWDYESLMIYESLNVVTFFTLYVFCVGCDFCTLGHHIQCGPDALSAIWVGRLIKTCSGATCAAVSDYAPRRLRVVGGMCRRKNPILLWHGFNKEGMSSAAV